MNDVIDISPPTQESRRLWAKALELAQAFGAHEQWALVGGLMVQLHVEDPRALAESENLRKSEKGWLRDVGELLAFDDAALTDALARNEVLRAEQAYELLAA